MKEYKAVILAAGFSKRLGFDKLTLRINGESVIRRATLPFIRAGIKEIIVVTGSNAEHIRNEFRMDNIVFVKNHNNALGMSTSVTAVLPFIEESDGVFFQLGDKPFIEDEIIHRLIEAYEGGTGKIAVPVFRGKKGHPILIRMQEYRDEIKSVAGDKGLREIIEKHSRDVISIKGDEGSLFDLDSAEDIELLRKRGYTVEESQSGRSFRPGSGS